MNEAGRLGRQSGDLAARARPSGLLCWPPPNVNWYYSDDYVAIAHGDCRELLLRLDAGSLDLVLTDPPYGFGHFPMDIPFEPALLRTWVNKYGTVGIFGYPELLVEWCVKAMVVPNEWITWWPTNSLRGRDKQLQRESEAIALWGQFCGKVLREQAIRSRSMALKYRMSTNPRGPSTIGDVWRDPKPGMAFNYRERLHPSEKPLTLMRRLIELISLPNQIVLDPFMGSGTTVVAAKHLGRKAIGIEVCEEYCEVAVKRMAQVPMIFEEPKPEPEQLALATEANA